MNRYPYGTRMQDLSHDGAIHLTQTRSEDRGRDPRYPGPRLGPNKG